MIMIITLWLLRRRPPLRERALVCPSVFNSCLSQETDRRRRLRSVCPDRQELNVAESSNLMHRCLITTDVCCAILSWQCHKKRSRQGSCHNAQAQNVSYFIFMAIDSSNLVVCCALTRYAKRSKDNGHDVFHIRHETLHNWGVNFRTVFKLRWNTVRLNKLKTAKRLKIKLISHLLAFMNAEFVFVCLSIGFG